MLILWRLQLVWRQHSKKRQNSLSDYWSNRTGPCSAAPLSVQSSYSNENTLQIRGMVSVLKSYQKQLQRSHKQRCLKIHTLLRRLIFFGHFTASLLPTGETMKGTEVPNPRRSSACDRTCVLTRNRSLSRDSHACHAHCFVPAHAKFAHEFLTLFHRPCAT